MAASVVGVILAGGRGERLGQREKSDLIFAGQPLLPALHKRVADQAGHWVLASDGFRPAACPGSLAILDDPFEDKRGPLAGVLAAYHWALQHGKSPDFLLSVPVDTPFFPKDFCSRARALIANSTTIIIGQYGRDKYPTAALWPMATLVRLDDWLAHSDNLSLRAYMQQFDVVTLDYQPSDPAANPFDNINRPGDLVNLERRNAP